MTNDEAIAVLKLYQYGDVDTQKHSFDLNDETVAHIIDALERDRWISVEEPPEEETDVFVRCVSGEYKQLSWIDTCFYADGRFWFEDPDDEECVTHWRPLPEPPKENET